MLQLFPASLGVEVVIIGEFDALVTGETDSAFSAQHYMWGICQAAPALRAGLLIGSTRLTAWQRRVLEVLSDGGDTEIVVLVVEDDRPGGRGAARWRRLLSTRGLWRLYNNTWVAHRSRAVQRVDGDDLLQNVPRLSVRPLLVGRYAQHFPDDALARLREFDLDLLLRFGFGILRGEVLDVARHGIWSFHHDDERVIRGGPPSFWEVADGLPTTGVLFQRLTDRLDSGVPLARATFRTVGYSYPRNRDRVAFGSVALPARVARQVRTGLLAVDDLPAATTDAPIRRDPTNVQMVRFAARHIPRSIAQRVRSIIVGARWAVGVALAPGGEATPDPAGIEWLPERGDGYDADPFPVEYEGRCAILVEEFDERSGRGTISALTRTGSGHWERVSGVIDPGVHASYPFPIRVDGSLFCVPETARAGRVEAWRCIELPDRWERVHTIVEAPVVDPTMVEWGGRWWMFGTRRDRDANAELWLWSAPAFAGPWEPHALNPVKIDVTSARPAGTPFVRDGMLYRPAQDCSHGYGGAIVVNRIDRLDERCFEETVVDRLDLRTDRYAAGNHTVAFGAGLVTIDGKRQIFDLHRSRRELAARLRRGR